MVLAQGGANIGRKHTYRDGVNNKMISFDGKLYKMRPCFSVQTLRLCWLRPEIFNYCYHC